MNDSKTLREGRTTGTCAAAAVAAAVHYLDNGERCEQVEIETPIGKRLRIETRFVSAEGKHASFAVIKDAGDDPDMTHGLEICAEVEILDHNGEIEFFAGDGVGTVSSEGLKIPCGEAAINPVPRKMIAKEVRKYFAEQAAKVTISIPGGEEVAKRTFNPRLGIVGGLSILGTTGIVRPMSSEALIDSIYEELNVKAAASLDSVIITFGAMGETALEALGYDKKRMVQASNYIGLALDRAAALQFKEIVIAGHVGKMIKIAAGIFMTHSANADARAEIVCCHAALNGADSELVEKLFAAKTTKAAHDILKENALDRKVWASIWRESEKRASIRAGREVKCVLLDDAGALLCENESEDKICGA